MSSYSREHEKRGINDPFFTVVVASDVTNKDRCDPVCGEPCQPGSSFPWGAMPCCVRSNDTKEVSELVNDVPTNEDNDSVCSADGERVVDVETHPKVMKSQNNPHRGLPTEIRPRAAGKTRLRPLRNKYGVPQALVQHCEGWFHREDLPIGQKRSITGSDLSSTDFHSSRDNIRNGKPAPEADAVWDAIDDYSSSGLDDRARDAPGDDVVDLLMHEEKTHANIFTAAAPERKPEAPDASGRDLLVFQPRATPAKLGPKLELPLPNQDFDLLSTSLGHLSDGVNEDELPVVDNVESADDELADNGAGTEAVTEAKSGADEGAGVNAGDGAEDAAENEAGDVVGELAGVEIPLATPPSPAVHGSGAVRVLLAVSAESESADKLEQWCRLCGIEHMMVVKAEAAAGVATWRSQVCRAFADLCEQSWPGDVCVLLLAGLRVAAEQSSSEDEDLSEGEQDSARNGVADIPEGTEPSLLGALPMYSTLLCISDSRQSADLFGLDEASFGTNQDLHVVVMLMCFDALLALGTRRRVNFFTQVLVHLGQALSLADGPCSLPCQSVFQEMTDQAMDLCAVRGIPAPRMDLYAHPSMDVASTLRWPIAADPCNIMSVDQDKARKLAEKSAAARKEANVRPDLTTCIHGSPRHFPRKRKSRRGHRSSSVGATPQNMPGNITELAFVLTGGMQKKKGARTPVNA